MTEETNEVVGTPEAATVAETSDYQGVLAGEPTTPESVEGAEKLEEETKPLEQKPEGQKPETDEEVVLEIGGKSFTMKQSEAVQLLENATKLQDRERALSDKEKSLNKDYTQKTQMLAGIRKSFDENFGLVPQPEEMKALGQVYKAYLASPLVKETIDRILQGTFDGGQPNNPQGKGDAYSRQLENKISMLESRLEGFLSATEQEKAEKVSGEAQNQWKNWVSEKEKGGVKITQEVDASMAPFVVAIKNAHPDWDASRILNEAYRHATIDTQEQTTAKKVLTNVDEAKKRGVIKITPKTPAKAEKEMSYAEIFSQAAQT
jgi:hypothetical protein